MHMLDRQVRRDLLLLTILTGSLFLPIMGRGFVHDDFPHLTSAAFDSAREVFSRYSWPSFYTPITELTFSLDWRLWGGRSAYPYAAVNLLLHIANASLLSLLARRLGFSHSAAFWTGLGFAFLFPASAWAVMWIGTRAHLLATFFLLLTMHATIWFMRTEGARLLPMVVVVLLAGLSIFSKENGVTVLPSVCIMVLYEARSRKGGIPYKSLAFLFIALAVVTRLYFWLRRMSGAAPPQIGDGGYHYVLSLGILSDNLLHYGLRTYGQISVIALAVVAALLIEGRRPSLKELRVRDCILSLTLFVGMIAPIVLLRWRSGIYTYLPAVPAALLLGAVVNSLYATASPVTTPRPRWRWVPHVFAVCILAGGTLGQSLRWIQMAEVNTTVLQQIAAQNAVPDPSTAIVLTYSEPDRVRRFPEGFSEYGFPYALRLLYGNPAMDGIIVREGEHAPPISAALLRFKYAVSDGKARVTKE